MYDIGDYQVSTIENNGNNFFKINYGHQSVIWALLKKGCVKEVSEYTIVFKEPLITHELTFLNHYGENLKVFLKSKQLHMFGVECELGVTTTKVKEELDYFFKKFS